MRVPPGVLTPQQARVLAYIRQRILEGMPPTRSEISKHFGWRSPNSAEDHIKALCRKGAIAMTFPGASRGIRLIERTTTETLNDRDGTMGACSRRNVLVPG
jgi:repressor LexA